MIFTVRLREAKLARTCAATGPTLDAAESKARELFAELFGWWVIPNRKTVTTAPKKETS